MFFFFGYPCPMFYISILILQLLLYGKAKLFKESAEVLADMIMYPTHTGDVVFGSNTQEQTG